MICEYCGKAFESEKGPGRPSKYCSNECCYNADKDRKRIQYVGKRQSVCAFCGKELPKFKTRFCSDECRQKHQNIKSGAIHHPDILSKECVICGKPFTTWRSRKVCCSEECAKKLNYQNNQNDKRYIGITIDKGITLKKVAQRDGNQCQICGFFVNWDDFIQTDKTIVCGNMYPSIDHIKPISLGGLHSWDNVQLAHRGCNSRKSNKVVS